VAEGAGRRDRRAGASTDEWWEEGDPRNSAGRGDHSPNAKGNFQFERVIAGWREQPVLDLRRK
jgi:hypothetical protein